MNRVWRGKVHQSTPNPNTPYYVIVNGVFGVVFFR